MMQAVGNLPVQGGAGGNTRITSASTTGINSAEADASRGGFGSAMTAALAQTPQKSEMDAGSQHDAQGAPQSGKNSVAIKEGKTASAQTTGQAVDTSDAIAKAVKSLPGAAQASDAKQDASVVTQAEGSAVKPADAGEPSTLGLQMLPAARLLGSPAIAESGAQAGVSTKDEKSSAGAAGRSDSTAEKGSQADSKKPKLKNSELPQVALPNVMQVSGMITATPVVAVRTAAFVAKSSGERDAGKPGDTKSDSRAARAIAASAIIAAGKTSGAAPAGNANPAKAASKTDPAPHAGFAGAEKIASAQSASTGSSVGAATNTTTTAALTAHAAPGTSDATTLRAQDAASKNAKSMSPAGASGNNGFTVALLNGQPGMAATAVTHTQMNAPAAGGGSAANPYTHMDTPQVASLTYASPQKMSIAVSDPSLGNFQVRAQSAGTQVAASLATASAATHAQLSGQLPSLTAFLQEQRVDLTRVTVVQQSMLGGDTGARGFGGQQGRSGSSGSRNARSQTGRIAAAGSIADVSGGLTDLGAGDGAAMPEASVSRMEPHNGTDGISSYVDVHV